MANREREIQLKFRVTQEERELGHLCLDQLPFLRRDAEFQLDFPFPVRHVNAPPLSFWPGQSAGELPEPFAASPG